MDFDGYAIGGLAVGEPPEVTREMIARTLELLPRDRPRYVMGVGYPDQIAEYARMGVDMMDCVLPTRAARHGLLFRAPEPGERQPVEDAIGEEESGFDRSGERRTAENRADPTAIRMNIKCVEYAEDQRPIDPACACPVCQRYTRAYLRHLFMAREPLGATLEFDPQSGVLSRHYGAGARRACDGLAALVAVCERRFDQLCGTRDGQADDVEVAAVDA